MRRRQNQASVIEAGNSQLEATLRRTQALLREANDELKRLATTFALEDPVSFLCECGRKGCCERLELSAEDYESVRRIPMRFILKRGHDNLADGRFAEARDGYVVIEKWGAAGAFAVRTDPRRRVPAKAVAQ